MFCTSCGIQISEDSKFCGNCGSQIEEEMETVIDEEINLNPGEEFIAGTERETDPVIDNNKHEEIRNVISQLSMDEFPPEQNMNNTYYQQPVNTEVNPFNSATQTARVLAVICSIACAAMLLLKWIRIPVIGYFNAGNRVSIFEIYSLIENANSIFGSPGGGMSELLIGAGAVILLCAICVLFYVISIFQLLLGNNSSRSSGFAAMLLTVILVIILQGVVVWVNSEMGGSYDYFNSVLTLAEVAYITPVLAIINYCAFVKRAVSN